MPQKPSAGGKKASRPNDRNRDHGEDNCVAIALRAHALRLQVEARRAEIEELARRGEPVDDLRRETAALRDSFRQIENDCAELQLQELLLAKERASYDATLKQMADSETEWMPSLFLKDPPTAPRRP